MAKLKVAVLVSGAGTNLQTLIEACREPAYPAEMVVVVSNNAGAYGLKRAQAAGIPALVIDHRDFKERADFDAALSSSVKDHGAEFICLAGFMRLLTEGFVRDWRDRLINIHPSLLPAFRGLNTHERAVEMGVRFSGCTVHFVRPEMDNGPIIVQAAVALHSDDTPERLRERVLDAEHRCYPLALRLIAEGRVRVINEMVRIDRVEAPGAALLNPRDT